MKAYVFQAALLCEECANTTMTALLDNGKRYCEALREESDDWPQGPYADGGGESDSPAHCDHCGEFLENPLTTDGMAYLAETIAAAYLAARCPAESVAIAVWAPFYGIA